MRLAIRFGLSPLLVLGALAAVPPAALAAGPAPAASPAPGATNGFTDRLFLSFAQDAAIVSSQWWEGQLEYDGSADKLPVDVLTVRGVVAFQPFRNIEIGGRLGFAKSSASPPLPEGSGATDLDAYAKYYFANAVDRTDFTAGLLLTVPTGDDTSGLGYNAFSEQAFGGVRYRLDQAIIGGHVGVRFNGHGKFQGVSLEGKTSIELAVNAVFPMSHDVSLVGEAHIETERFKNMDSTAELLAGVNWRAFGRGMFRGALGAGLTDSAPKYRILVGYAYSF
jgi:hypothetical protein